MQACNHPPGPCRVTTYRAREKNGLMDDSSISGFPNALEMNNNDSPKVSPHHLKSCNANSMTNFVYIRIGKLVLNCTTLNSLIQIAIRLVRATEVLVACLTLSNSS